MKPDAYKAANKLGRRRWPTRWISGCGARRGGGCVQVRELLAQARSAGHRRVKGVKVAGRRHRPGEVIKLGHRRSGTRSFVLKQPIGVFASLGRKEPWTRRPRREG